MGTDSYRCKRFSLVNPDASFTDRQIDRIREIIGSIGITLPYQALHEIQLKQRARDSFVVRVIESGRTWHAPFAAKLCKEANLHELRELDSNNHLFHVIELGSCEDVNTLGEGTV